MDVSEAIHDIATAARKGDLAGVTAALDLMVGGGRYSRTIMEARALVDRRTGTVGALAQLAEDPLPAIAAYNDTPPTRPFYAPPSSPTPKKRRKAA